MAERYEEMEFTLGLYELMIQTLDSVIYDNYSVDKDSLLYLSEMDVMELDRLSKQDSAAVVKCMTKRKDVKEIALLMRYVATSVSRIASELEQSNKL